MKTWKTSELLAACESIIKLAYSGREKNPDPTIYRTATASEIMDTLDEERFVTTRFVVELQAERDLLYKMLDATVGSGLREPASFETFQQARQALRDFAND